MPVGVRESVNLLMSPQGGSDARWGVRAAVLVDRPVDDDQAQQWVEEELRVLEAVETVKAWADAVGLGALRRLREAVGEQVRALDDLSARSGRGMPPHVLRAESDTAAVDEVVLATGLSQGDESRRLDLAIDTDGRGALLHAALADGRVSLSRAVRIHQDTSGLGVEEVHAICARLLLRNGDGSVRSERAFRRELRRQVALHTPDAAQARADALTERTAYATLDPTMSGAGIGMGTLVMTGEAGRVAAAMDRVDHLARRLRSDGDERTLNQLRSDVALDLLLYGWRASCHDAQGHTTTVDLPELSARTFVGQAPPARVTVTVSLATLLGEEHGVGELPGYGYLSGEHVRSLAFGHGSAWRRLVTDPVTGAALDLTTHRYRPTAAMAATVAALDGVCRAPGCTTSADRCDVDHNRPWPAGDTRIANLTAKHRRHHNHKSRGTWTAATDGDGTTVWRTLSGRTYVTHRHDYDDPLGRLVSDPEVESATAAAHAASPFDDPPPS
ncbi:MAG TPA: HNH endonuclease [Lapillicoccus sp.]|nr:HNH endonuclease [Lapillicoccus sp.]